MDGETQPVFVVVVVVIFVVVVSLCCCCFVMLLLFRLVVVVHPVAVIRLVDVNFYFTYVFCDVFSLAPLVE